MMHISKTPSLKSIMHLVISYITLFTTSKPLWPIPPDLWSYSQSTYQTNNLVNAPTVPMSKSGWPKLQPYIQFNKYFYLIKVPHSLSLSTLGQAKMMGYFPCYGGRWISPPHGEDVNVVTTATSIWAAPPQSGHHTEAAKADQGGEQAAGNVPYQALCVSHMHDALSLPESLRPTTWSGGMQLAAIVC